MPRSETPRRNPLAVSHLEEPSAANNWAVPALHFEERKHGDRTIMVAKDPCGGNVPYVAHPGSVPEGFKAQESVVEGALMHGESCSQLTRIPGLQGFRVVWIKEVRKLEQQSEKTPSATKAKPPKTQRKLASRAA